jgi:ribosomal protein S18 acetylase RimI-like enzyme
LPACGFTWARVCVLDVLWVADGQRRSGIGSRLLAAVEQLAIAGDCIQVVASTHAFQAPRFYLARGYQVCGSVVDYPPGSADIKLAKRLQGASGALNGTPARMT